MTATDGSVVGDTIVPGFKYRMCTVSGRAVAPLVPEQGLLYLPDIAHALAMQCRWGGHTREFYSVAQHCVLVSEILPPAWQLWGLLHDAAEAYLHDLIRPIKRAFRDNALTVYDDAERAWLQLIVDQYGLQPLVDGEAPRPVKLADNWVGLLEARELMPRSDEWDAWRRDWYQQLLRTGEALDDIPQPQIQPCWSPAQAHTAFLQRFVELREGQR